MDAYIASLEQIESWFFSLAKKKQFFYPKKTEGVNYRFEPLDDVQAMDFSNYRPTILPPVKNLFPDGEVLFTYHKDQQGHYHFNQTQTIEAQILAGVRACDLKAIHLLDKVFSDGIPDSHYLQRREKTAIIAFKCLTPCDDHCFCETAQSLDFETGADIFVTAIKQQWLLEVLTEHGRQLAQTLEAEHCSEHSTEHHLLKQRALASRPRPFGRQFVTAIAHLAKIVHEQDANDVYQQYAERCFSCGTCNLVCPTCYCFDTKDELALNGQSGKKTRHWDACLNPGFAEVAGGHNFRAQPAERQRHRIRRKFDYLQQRFDDTFCTGCGRCGRQCTTGIDIFDIVNDVCQFYGNSDAIDNTQEVDG